MKIFRSPGINFPAENVTDKTRLSSEAAQWMINWKIEFHSKRRSALATSSTWSVMLIDSARVAFLRQSIFSSSSIAQRPPPIAVTGPLCPLRKSDANPLLTANDCVQSGQYICFGANAFSHKLFLFFFVLPSQTFWNEVSFPSKQRNVCCSSNQNNFVSEDRAEIFHYEIWLPR